MFLKFRCAKFGQAFLLAVMAVAPPAADAKADDKVSLVRLTHSNGWDALPAIVAQERGFFYDERLVVSNVGLDSAVTTANSVVVGSSDVAILPQRVFLALAEAKRPVKAISIVSWGMPMALVVGPDGPKSLDQLRNRTVAISKGSDALAYFIRLLNQSKLQISDVKIRAMSTSGLARALSKGQADAVFEIEPFIRAIKTIGPTRVLMGEEEVQKALGAIGSIPLVANAKFLEREPETAQRFVNAWVKALRYMQQNKEDAVRLLRVFLHRNGAKVPSDLAKAWFSAQRYDLYVWSKNAIAEAEYNAWALHKAGALKTEVKITPYIDNQFVSRAVQQVAQK